MHNDKIDNEEASSYNISAGRNVDNTICSGNLGDSIFSTGNGGEIVLP